MATFFGESIVSVTNYSWSAATSLTIPAGQYARITIIGGSFTTGGNRTFTIAGAQLAQSSTISGFTINGTITEDRNSANAIIGNQLFLGPGGVIQYNLFTAGGAMSIQFTVAIFNLP